MWDAHAALLKGFPWCRGYDEYDYAVIIHRGRLSTGRRPVVCRMFPVFHHHTMLMYFRQAPACSPIATSGFTCCKLIRPGSAQLVSRACGEKSHDDID